MMSGALRRIGIIGDIHAEHERLNWALRCLAAQSLDAILATGDIVDGPGDVDICCDMLARNNVAAVRGNHERWFAAGYARGLPFASMKETLTRATLAFLEQLPIVRTFDTVQGELMLCHGLWRHDTGVLLPGDSAEAMAQNAPLQALLKKCGSKYVVNGHTHVRMVKTLADRTFVNAGTLLRTDHPCFAVVDFERLVVLYFDVDESGDIIEDGVFSMV